MKLLPQSNNLSIQGVRLLNPKIFQDGRGVFVKIYNQEMFRLEGIDFIAHDQFYSISYPNVIRGMHFQSPPHEHVKLVTCMSGCILDVLLDLRRASPTYGNSLSIKLSCTNRNVLYIPSGIAHGFCVLGRKNALVHYCVSSLHVPSHDHGVLWNSFNFITESCVCH
jgi:dTDP-4-dehydrorhamnose 3,5-epimerase